jgi:G3E family GTPase
MQLIQLDDVTSDAPAEVYVGDLALAASPVAGVPEGSFVFSDRRPFKGLKAACLTGQMWPHEITANGFFWIDSQPDICFRLRIADGTASYRPAGRWLASRIDTDTLPHALTRAIAGEEWDRVYGDRMQRICFHNAAADKPYITSMLQRSLIDEIGGGEAAPTV